MQILENISLKRYNTFGIAVSARYYSAFSNLDELIQLLTHEQVAAGSRLTSHVSRPGSIWKMANSPGIPTFTLGGGSNILFTRDFNGLVLKNEVSGITELHEDPDYVYVKAGAGENWHQFVQYSLQRNWAGVENLSLIPGNVGAAPMQNIGAYGVELQDVFLSLEAFHLHDKTIKIFTLNDCEFGYRESVFKKRYKDQFIILSVTFRLRKQPVFHVSYGAIEQELGQMGVQKLSIQAISQAVINIRTSKLPDPKVIGNAGSFFKNPEITNSRFEILKKQFPEIIGYSLVNGNVKLAAGWLIEQCGWKGIRRGDAGCHAKQALVLVNYGNANGKDIYDLSEEIFQSVKKKFAVELEREVNIV